MANKDVRQSKRGMPGTQLRTLQAGVGGPWQLPSAPGNFSIGRKACCQLVLPESYAYVSGEHCRLKLVEGANGNSLVLEDLSGNGTFINGRKVGRGKIQNINIGDEISLAKPTRKGGAIKFHVEVCDGLTPPAHTVPAAPPAWAATPPQKPPEARVTPPATPAAVSLASAMARDAQQREEDCRILEQRINAEKGRCARLEEELKEAQRLLQKADFRGAVRHEVQRDCEELRESLRRVAESQPLERARLAAAEAARHDRRECARLRAELQEEQRCAQQAEEENMRLRNEVQEASNRTLHLEAEVKREADFNASLEEQAAAACKEWCRSREAVSVARRRLEDRGAALTTLRTAMRNYHQKVSDRLAALERCLQQVPSESPSQTLEPRLRKDGVCTGAGQGAVHVGSMEAETPTQDADAAAGAAVATVEIVHGAGGETPEAKRLRVG